MMDWLAAYQNVVSLVLINAILGLSMWLAMSAGMVSLAGAGLAAIGGYVSALLSVHLNLAFPWSLAAGALAAGLAGLLVAVPLSRLQTHYLAIASLGFTLVLVVVGINWRSLTGGSSGMFGIPLRTSIPGLVISLSGLAILAAALYRSHLGRVLYSVGDDEVVSSAFGLNVQGVRLAAFTGSALLAGLAGGLLAHQIGVLQPQQFNENFAFLMLAFAIFGGIRHWSGPVVGAVIMTTIPEVSREVGDYREVLAGVLILVAIIYVPEGIVQPLPIRRWLRRRLESTRSARRVESHGRDLPEAIENTGVSSKPIGGRDLEQLRSQRDMDSSVRVRSLSKAFGGVVAVDQVDFALEVCELHGLIGPNGSGKSTLVNLIGGQLAADEGEIVIKGRSVSGQPARSRAALGLVRTFQTPRVPPDMSVYDSVAIGQEHLRSSRRVPTTVKEEAFRKALDLLSAVDITDPKRRAGRELSYGQQRIVELARCLAAVPSVVLLDEPTSGLNPLMISLVETYMASLLAVGTSILLIEHNIPFVMRNAHSVTVLDEGRILASGPPNMIANDARVLDAYLGSRVAKGRTSDKDRAV